MSGTPKPADPQPAAPAGDDQAAPSGAPATVIDEGMPRWATDLQTSLTESFTAAIASLTSAFSQAQQPAPATPQPAPVEDQAVSPASPVSPASLAVSSRKRGVVRIRSLFG